MISQLRTPDFPLPLFFVSHSPLATLLSELFLWMCASFTDNIVVNLFAKIYSFAIALTSSVQRPHFLFFLALQWAKSGLKILSKTRLHVDD